MLLSSALATALTVLLPAGTDVPNHLLGVAPGSQATHALDHAADSPRAKRAARVDKRKAKHTEKKESRKTDREALRKEMAAELLELQKLTQELANTKSEARKKKIVLKLEAMKKRLEARRAALEKRESKKSDRREKRKSNRKEKSKKKSEARTG